MVGQTHSVMTHKRFYVKQHIQKKRKYEEGKSMQDTFQKTMIENPLPVFQEKTLSITEESAIEERTTQIFEETTTEICQNITYNTSTTASIGSEAVVEDIIEFGFARGDLNKKGFRFEWTKSEIAHLQYYILNIEPNLSDSERRNKYSSCLNYLKKANILIQHDFHPFHCENSGRIKTGYEVALKNLDN